MSRLRRSAVQIADENTLVLWSYDPISQTWSPLSGTLHLQNNTVTAAVIEPGLLALAGEIYSGPWKSIVEQSLGLPPTLTSGTLSLLYHVVGALPPQTPCRSAWSGQARS